MPAFGRLVSHDPRSDNYPLRSLLQARSKRHCITWKSIWHSDQGDKPYCTAYSLLNLIEHAPRYPNRQKGFFAHAPKPLIDPSVLYNKAQAIDPWAKQPHTGSTVTAMMQVAKNYGILDSYHWERSNIENVIDAVLLLGPIVVGSNWYEGMMKPIGPRWELFCTGKIVGGHAYVIDAYRPASTRTNNFGGVNRAHPEQFRIFNSWGKDWGYNSCAWISTQDLERLMQEDGEVCFPVECDYSHALQS